MKSNSNIVFVYAGCTNKNRNQYKKNLDKAVELVGGGSVINGAYPVLF